MIESSTVPRGARNPFLVGGALRGIISPDTIVKTFHNLMLIQQKLFGSHILMYILILM